MHVELVITMMDDDARVCNFCTMGRGVDWAVQEVAHLRQWLVDGRKPHEMRALRPDWSLECFKTKIKQLRRGPLQRWRTTEVLAEIETAVTETPRQTLSVLRQHSSLDMSRATLWSAVLQARPCATIDSGEPLGKIELFCRDVLQRVDVLSVRGKRHLEALGPDARGVTSVQTRNRK